jgi:hypothetical protein
MVLWCSVEGPLWAASLADQLDAILRQKAFQPLDVEVPLLERTVLQGADFPLASTTPDFAYRFDPDLGVYERVPKSAGPLFVDTADTVGEKALEVGASLLFSEFTRRDGDRLPGTVPRFNFLTKAVGEQSIALRGKLVFDRFDLSASALSLSVTYGVTARWDVGAIVQAVETVLDARGRTEINVQGFTVPLERFAIDDTKFGVGDVLLKTKYVLGEVQRFAVAPSLTLRIPTGRTENFQGLGDFFVTPGLLISRQIGPHAVHTELGIAANANDLGGSKARYGIGASLRVREGISILLELVGKSALVEQAFEVETAPFRGVATLPRTDIVDTAIGVKARFLSSGVAFLSVVLPVTRDGVRADAVPVGGVELTF